MKKILLSIFVVLFCIACDPVEDRDKMTGNVTTEQLNVTATPVVVNGINSNKIVLENNSPVLSTWDYGLGISTKAYDEVLMVVPGESKITFTGRNGDGTYITKELTVQVDELSFEVPAEWAYLCGAGEKTWTWAADEPCYGNGGYLSNVSPGWWQVWVDDVEAQTEGEGKGAEMIFSTTGASLTKIRTDGTSEQGSFAFDMTKTINDAGGSAIWAKGVLTTSGTTILVADSPSGDKGTVTELNILDLTSERMALSYAPDGTGAWGSAHYWVFKPK